MPHYADSGERLIGPDGVSWIEIAAWLEPAEVFALVDRKVPVAINWCESWEWPARIRPEVEKMIVTTDESHRLAKGKYGGHSILAPSLWVQYEGGPLLVVLSEEGAKRRNVLAGFTKLDPRLLDR